VSYHSSDEPYIELTSTAANADQVALATAGDDAAPPIQERRPVNVRSRVRPHRVRSHNETNPFISAFHSVENAIRLLVGDPQPKKKRAVASRL
jgi:hypothetical protein